jgi:hypothetical protein
MSASAVSAPSDESNALAPPTCAECGRPWFDETERWRSYLTVDDEAKLFCVDCARREFAFE